MKQELLIEGLLFQNEVWKEHELQLWDRAGVGQGHRIADVGCGPGGSTLDLARRVGNEGRVFAVDPMPALIEKTEAFVRQRNLENVEVIASDFAEAKLTDLDFVYLRWVAYQVKETKDFADNVLESLAVGGRAIVMDYENLDYQFGDAPDSFAKFKEAMIAFWDSGVGNIRIEPAFSDSLVSLGLKLVWRERFQDEIKPTTQKGIWVDRHFKNLLPVLVEKGFLTESFGETFRLEWNDWRKAPGVTLSLPKMCCSMVEKT